MNLPLSLIAAWAVALGPPGPDSLEFFEARVRPVLARHCYSCHGPEKQKAGLRLDSGEALRRGGESGPVLEPDDPDQSSLLVAVRHDDPALKMPPKGKLPAAAVADLEAWVRMGAPWPAEAAPAPAKTATDPEAAIAEARARHWAFRPVVEPDLPAVADAAWPSGPVDRFVLARLEAAGLAPSPPADRRTLIRRATFDVTGLPPTPEEVGAFERDTAPDAFAKVVDRLLASPHYGERWGRHWLDVARYADTKGYVYSDREEPRFPFSYAYRDYVIRSFNDDKPYDRFLKEQLAADLMLGPGDRDRSSLAALGFLTLGRRFLGNVHDIIDDRLDVIFRGTQALTVACARCHDHKYDPIPTADYYSLYGVLAGTTEATVRLADAPPSTDEARAYEAELRAREAALADAMTARREGLSERLRDRVDQYLAAVLEADKLPGDDHYLILEADDLNPVIVRRWVTYLLRTREPFHPIFAPWNAFAALPASRFADEAPALARRFARNDDPDRRLHPLVARLFEGEPPRSMAEVAGRYAALLGGVHRDWKVAVAASIAAKGAIPRALADPAREALRLVLYAADAPTTVPPLHINLLENYFDEKTRVALGQLQKRIDEWHLQSPAAPPHALILDDTPTQKNPRVFLRGNPKTKGDEVPRRFLAVLSGSDRTPFAHGSGRLELAEAIADPANPLTARVLVNRVWMHHFGEGLVRTPSDFGARSEPPTHPELLDWLAARFMAEGWSIKGLHRKIMLSQTYQQASGGTAESRLEDPENRLLGRRDRRRLDWEALRDALLAASGKLDRSIGGRPVPLTTPPYATRRTIYGYVDRQDLPTVFRIFDLASPDQHTPQRHNTTIPQQALFLMNSPFVVEQARALASRPEVGPDLEPGERVRNLYRHLMQRDPTSAERTIGLQFLAEPPGEPPTHPEPPPSAWSYGVGRYDEAAKRVASFRPLAQWAGDAWQLEPGSAPAPPRLTREGGEPGRGPDGAAIRRWVAPRKGTIGIGGAARHSGAQGDGVLVVVASERAGELGRWELHDREVEAKVSLVDVEAGEAIDFVVIGRADPAVDAFTWAPRVRLIGPRPVDGPTEWKADEEFLGPPTPPPAPLTPWEEYAHALLMANEFAYLD